MTEWYYLDGGQQIGPLSDDDIKKAVARGAVTGQTLVWRAGLAGWEKYEIASSAGASDAFGVAPVAGISTGSVVCSQCGGRFTTEEAILFESLWVCAGCKPTFFQKLKEGARPAGLMEYAGIGQRFLARVLDGLIVGVPLMILLGLSMFLLIGRMESQPADSALPLASVLLMELGMYAIWGAYNILMIGRYGATVGKMALKIRIVTAGGGRVSYARAAGRFFAEILSGMILYIGYIIAFFDSERRALHDHICSTRVIRA
ncbi:MAG: RDD family protein [Acidobacteriota bacterium]